MKGKTVDYRCIAKPVELKCYPVVNKNIQNRPQMLPKLQEAPKNNTSPLVVMKQVENTQENTLVKQ